jgi:uncharacterized spore protein YtfJ
MALNFETILGSITSELKTIAKTESVVGEPIEIAGKIIIPVIKIKLGFGAGAGEDMSGGKHAGGSGGGGGGGVSIEPAAFITIVGDEISVLSPKGSRFEKIAESVPGIVTKIMEIKGKAEESSPEEEEPA